jgi:sulfur carrier protein ThiS
MEAITKKSVSIEFQGEKYALSDDSTIEDLLVHLGLPKDKVIRLRVTRDGFIMIS